MDGWMIILLSMIMTVKNCFIFCLCYDCQYDRLHATCISENSSKYPFVTMYSHPTVQLVFTLRINVLCSPAKGI